MSKTHVVYGDVRRCKYVCGIVEVYNQGSGIMIPKGNHRAFRLYEVVFEAILDHSKLILTLK